MRKFHALRVTAVVLASASVALGIGYSWTGNASVIDWDANPNWACTPPPCFTGHPHTQNDDAWIVGETIGAECCPPPEAVGLVKEGGEDIWIDDLSLRQAIKFEEPDSTDDDPTLHVESLGIRGPAYLTIIEGATISTY